MRVPQKIFLISSVIVFSCGTNSREPQSKKDTNIPPIVPASTKDSSEKKGIEHTKAIVTDTLTIDTRTAVFYQPDSLQIEKRMKQSVEADFRAGMDDYVYYINMSAEYLEKQGLPVIDAKSRKILRFIMADKKIALVKPDTLEELWGLYLFDPKKKPRLIDITNVEEEFKNYYKFP